MCATKIEVDISVEFDSVLDWAANKQPSLTPEVVMNGEELRMLYAFTARINAIFYIHVDISTSSVVSK